MPNKYKIQALDPWAITHQGKGLLFDEQPLVIRPTLACLIGLNEAIIMQQVHYWVTLNAKAGRNERDGYHWTYNSIPTWQDQFPFWSYNTIQRILRRLTGEKTPKSKIPPLPKLLITGRYNQLQIDRTLWYRIDYDALGILAKSKVPITDEIPLTWQDHRDEPQDSTHFFNPDRDPNRVRVPGKRGNGKHATS